MERLNLARTLPLHIGGLLRRILAAILLIAGCSGGRRVNSEPIVLGLAGPFSQPRGASMQRAAELAVKEINARGGIRGRRVALRIMDDSARPEVAIRIARALVDDPSIVAVIGHLTSGTSLAAGRVYGEARRPVVMISPSASSPDLSGVNPYVFRICPSDLSHGAQLARFARQTLGARRVGVIYVDDDYGRGLRLSFAAEFRRLGGEIVEEDPALSATPSLEPYLARLRMRGGVDAVMLATERGGAELALRDMARIGVRWPVLGGDALTGIEGAGPLAEGVRVSSAYLVDRPGVRNERFVEGYARAYPGERPDHRGAGAYDIVQLLAAVFADAGTDRRAIRDRVARIGTDAPAFEGVTGTIVFDAHGDVPAKSVVIGAVREGRLVTEAAQ
jgi:branched-chain amino acid transport system substrate-binding protein